MSYLDVILADNPSIIYKLDEPSGTTVTDYSGHSDTGTIVGTVGYQVPGPVAERPYGMNLNVASVKIRNTLTLNFPIATVEVWMNAATPAADSQIVGFVQANSAATSDKDMINTSLGKLRDYAFDGAAKTTGDTVVVIGNSGWHLLHLVADGVNLSAYIDGNAEGTRTACGNTFAGYAAGQPSIQLGGSQSGLTAAWQSQQLAWFAVYPTALSPGRVLAHYQAASLTAPVGQYQTHHLGRGAGW